MEERLLISPRAFQLTLRRLCLQLVENYGDFENTALIGVQPRGVRLAREVYTCLKDISPSALPEYGYLDITFYRDDFRQAGNSLAPGSTNIEFSLEDKKVILIDDVLYTGRTIRSALDALLDYGRPKSVELMVLIDRRLHRHVPVEAQYIGRSIDSFKEERVIVQWNEVQGHQVFIQEKTKAHE